MPLTPQEAATLKDYILNGANKDTYAPYVAAGNDNQVAVLLNTTHSKIVGLVNRATLMAVMMNLTHSSGMPVWLMIVDTAADSGANAQLRAACRMIGEVAKAPFENIDLSLAGVSNSLNALLAATYLTQGQLDYINAQGNHPLSDAEFALSKAPESLSISVDDVSYILRGV